MTDWLGARDGSSKPSDFYPSALRSSPSERKVFDLLATIAFNRAAAEAKEASNVGEKRGSIDQTDDP